MDRKTLKGDTNPAEFDINATYSVATVLELLKRNPILKVAVIWKVDEMLRRGIIFEDETINRTHLRFGKPEVYTEFSKFIRDQKVDEEIALACKWSQCFGDALLVLFKADEDEVYSKCRAYYPRDAVSGSGFEIESVSNGEPTQYKVWMPNDQRTLTTDDNYTIYPADQCVVYSAPRLEETWGGTSAILDILPYARAFEILTNSIAQRGAKMGAAPLVFETPENPSSEMVKKLKTIDGNSINALTKMVLTNGMTAKFLTPAMSGDITALVEIMFKIIATSLRISRSRLTGDDAGAIAAGRYSALYSNSTIQKLQVQYYNAMTQTYYKLGLETPDFEWVDPNDEIGQSFSPISTGMTEHPVLGEPEIEQPAADSDELTE